MEFHSGSGSGDALPCLLEMKQYPSTPDGRYFVVKGRLWRCANPSLSEAVRQGLVDQLMGARRAVRRAKAGGSDAELQSARACVHQAKVALGERGPVWWTDGSPDYNQSLVKNTPYSDWYASLD